MSFFGLAHQRSHDQYHLWSSAGKSYGLSGLPERRSHPRSGSYFRGHVGLTEVQFDYTIALISLGPSRRSSCTLIMIYSATSLIRTYISPTTVFKSPYLPFPTTPLLGMQMYCQSPNYVVCPNNESIYPPDRSSPPPAHPVTPHTPRSLSFLPQLGQVCTDFRFFPNPPLSSPSSSSGTVSSTDSSPYSSPVERFVGDDYSYPYVPFVEPQQYVFLPLNPIESQLIIGVFKI